MIRLLKFLAFDLHSVQLCEYKDQVIYERKYMLIDVSTNRTHQDSRVNVLCEVYEN